MVSLKVLLLLSRVNYMKLVNYLILFIFFFTLGAQAQEKRFITVAQDGSGEFKTITAAIQSLPYFNYQRTVIFVKNGIYNEKIRIDQDYVTLRGENRDKTILQYSQLRTDWIANKDSTGAILLQLAARLHHAPLIGSNPSAQDSCAGHLTDIRTAIAA